MRQISDHIGGSDRRQRAAVVLAALLAAVTLVASASSTNEAAAVEHGPAYTLGNGAIQLAFTVRDGRLSGLEIADKTAHRALPIPSAFAFTLQDGAVLRLSEMGLAGHPRIEALKPAPDASRLSERLGGKQICVDLQPKKVHAALVWCAVLRDGSQYMRQELTIRATDQPLAITQVQLLALDDVGARVVGSVKGSPVVDASMFLAAEHPLSTSAVEGDRVSIGLPRVLPLPAGQSITYASVVGVGAPGQMRRSFLTYIERERAHPYRTFLHYNTWYDLGFNNRYDEAGALDRVHAFGEQLVRKRGVTLDSFLFDDGWDDPGSLWGFNPGFPHGFTPVRDAATRYGFGIGVWLSPWGGYDEAKRRRIAFGEKAGYETVRGGFALSGQRYYAKFEQTCLEMIRDYGVNQFKFDGTGNASQVVPGSLFDSDFAAAIHLIERLRQQEPKVFINLTTGTYPSPFWLRYADSIWRGGEDHSFTGVGTWRQKWITYRDALTYKNVVKAGPLFPLNSLMLHGLIYAQYAEHLSTDPGHDFPAEVRSYFGSGTQLQEMYITPSLLKAEDWDVLAESAKWSRANAATLKDTHWVGGDPAALEVYGWAAWSPEKGIVTLRNPADRVQEFTFDPKEAFELPPDAPHRYEARSPWHADAGTTALTFEAGKPQHVTLQPFQVLTLEAHPLR